MLRHDKDIFTEDEKKRLDNVIKMNEPLSKAYILNEYLQEVWKQDSYKEGEAVLDDWIKQARESKFPPLKSWVIPSPLTELESGLLQM